MHDCKPSSVLFPVIPGESRQRMFALFSATLSPDCRNLFSLSLGLPLTVVQQRALKVSF